MYESTDLGGGSVKPPAQYQNEVKDHNSYTEAILVDSPGNEGAAIVRPSVNHQTCSDISGQIPGSIFLEVGKLNWRENKIKEINKEPNSLMKPRRELC